MRRTCQWNGEKRTLTWRAVLVLNGPSDVLMPLKKMVFRHISSSLTPRLFLDERYGRNMLRINRSEWGGSIHRRSMRQGGDVTVLRTLGQKTGQDFKKGGSDKHFNL